MKKIKLKNKTKQKIYLAVPAAFILLLISFFLFSGSQTLGNKNWQSINTPLLEKKNYTIYYVFWSDCGACFNLSQNLNGYLSSKRFVNLEKIPATGVGWMNDAQLFHTIEAISQNKQRAYRIYNTYVNRIHSRENPLRNFNQKRDFLADQLNVSIDEFNTVFNGEEVNNMMIRSQEINKAINVRSVPQLVINGEYVLNMSSFNSYQDVFQQIDELFENNK